MRFNGPTSSSDCEENGRGNTSNNLAANTLTASNGEDKKQEKKNGETNISGDSIAVSSAQANASSGSESHVALVKHIKWQE